jgi:imidazolonepropionase-like amidohydrolase
VELLHEAGFSVPEAIRIATLNGATYMGIAARVGSLAVGKRADFVVLGGDPLAADSDLRTLPVLGTYVDGEAVFSAE